MPKNRINILYIIDYLHNWGGTEKHLFYLLRHLDRQKFCCSLLCFDSDRVLAQVMSQENTQVYQFRVAKYYTPVALHKAFQLRKIIKQNKTDIVQSFHYKSDTYGVSVARRSGVKHIISSRRDIGDTKKMHHKLLNRLMNRYIDKFITACTAVSEQIIRDEGVPESKITTIYNGVQLDKYTVPDRNLMLRLKQDCAFTKEDFVIGMVANFRPEKNHNIFLSAIKQVAKLIRNLKVILIGDGPTLPHCKDFCEKNGMKNLVYFTGAVENVRKYIAIMDVACLVPGSNEGFSNAVLEKMAMGKPMIVTAVGGNSEAVFSGKNGIIIPPFNHRELANAILYLYKNPRIRIQMGKESRARVEQYFTLEKMIEEHQVFYENLMFGSRC